MTASRVARMRTAFEAHHSVKDVDWLAGSRSHPVEILINQTIEYAPIVILGAHPDVAFMKGILDATWGMYIHSNIGVRMGVLQYVFNGPEMHRWHHALAPGRPVCNFGNNLSVFDWWFGTAYLSADHATTYGIPERDYPHDNIVRQWLYAFRPAQPVLAPVPAAPEL